MALGSIFIRKIPITRQINEAIKLILYFGILFTKSPPTYFTIIFLECDVRGIYEKMDLHDRMMRFYKSEDSFYIVSGRLPDCL